MMLIQRAYAHNLGVVIDHKQFCAATNFAPAEVPALALSGKRNVRQSVPGVVKVWRKY
jgi:hypothetical protein